MSELGQMIRSAIDELTASGGELTPKLVRKQVYRKTGTRVREDYVRALLRRSEIDAAILSALQLEPGLALSIGAISDDVRLRMRQFVPETELRARLHRMVKRKEVKRDPDPRSRSDRWRVQ